MEFYARPNGKFYAQLVFSLIALSTTVVIADIVEINHRYYLLVIWLCLALVVWVQFAMFLSIILNSKPLLIVDENFVYDRIYDIKFIWDDVEAITLIGSTLHVDLYQPTTYLEKIKNPIRRRYYKIYCKLTNNSPFKISLSFVNANKNSLLEVLRMYSDKS